MQGIHDLPVAPAVVNKLVTRLERRPGARLVHRSTRGIRLTEEACAFYGRGLRVLADLAKAEQAASKGTPPTGRNRINADVPFGRHFLFPALPDFLALYPGLLPEVTLTDTVVNLIGECADDAIRAGPLKSSRPVARSPGRPPDATRGPAGLP